MTAASIRFARLVQLSGQPERTLRRQLQARGIVCEGFYVMLSSLRDGWPSLFNSVLIVMEGQQPCCPDCGSPTQRACTACEFVAA